MTRTTPDSCPGVLRLHPAADGPLARVRLPGGRLHPEQLAALAEATREVGNGNIELTSRGNVQLRQVADAADLAQRLESAGLLPSYTHERVRNIIASPSAGRVSGQPDVHGLVAELDAGLLADARLAGLPGRVLFGLDDGRGDVSGANPDIGAHATTNDQFAVLLAGRDSGIRVSESDIVDVLLAAAHGFLELSSGQWRLHEIDNGVARIVDLLGLDSSSERLTLEGASEPPIGWLPQDDGLVSLGAGVPLGSLPARTAEFVAAIERPVLITVHRGLVITDLAEAPAEQVVRVLAPMGLIFDVNSPWLQVSACAGLPGCAKSHTDVRADATQAVASGRVVGTTAAAETGTSVDLASPTAVPAEHIVAAGRQHWSGCERGCGRPTGPITEVTASPDGYRITSS